MRGSAPWAVAACIAALAALAGVVLRPISFVDMAVWDDLTLVPAATGAAPTLEQLWAPHNGHRLVLPKALMGLALSLGGDRWWAPRFLSLLCLGGSTALFLALARRVRGRLALEDLVIPLAFLSPRLVSSFIHAFDVQFALHTTWVALALWLAFGAVRGSRLQLAGAAAVLGALALSGMSGLVFGAVFAPFLAAHAFDWESAAARRRARWHAPLLVGASWLCVGLMLTWSSATPGSGSGVARAKTALQFLAMAFGPAGARFWPLTGWLAAALVLATLAALWRLRSEKSPRELGLLSGAVIASLAVAAAVGWGRAGWGGNVQAGLGERFTLLASGLVALGHLGFTFATQSADARLGRLGRGASWALVVVLAAAVPSALSDARRRAEDFRVATAELTRDVHRGMPIGALAERHERVYPWDRDALAGFLRLMCEHRLGPYREAPPTFFGCAVGALEARVLEAPPDGPAIVELPFRKLAELEPRCDGVAERFGPSCARAIHSFCRGRGHDSGFGPVENAGPVAIVACVRGGRVEATWPELGGLNEDCRLDGTRVGACFNAAHRLCLERGSRAGWFVPGRPDVTCFDTPREVPVLGFDELERQHGDCFQPTQAFVGDCAAAIHRACRARGATTGFGPVSLDAGRVTVTCL